MFPSVETSVKTTVFTTSDELFYFLQSVYEPGLDVDIATFSMYLGVSKGRDWSIQYPSPVRSFIDHVQTDKLRVVLGKPAFIECAPGCQHCLIRYEANKQRNLDTAKMLGLNIRIHERLHLKYYRIGDLVIVGGINLSASDNVDAALIVTDWDQRSVLMDLFESAWTDSLPIDRALEVVS